MERKVIISKALFGPLPCLQDKPRVTADILNWCLLLDPSSAGEGANQWLSQALILPLFTPVSMEKYILSLKTAAREREGSGEIDQWTLAYT